MSPLFAFFEGAFSPSHILIVLVVGMVLFGKRLPEVGRYLGKSIVEFKKGIKGMEDDLEATVSPRPEPGKISPPPKV